MHNNLIIFSPTIKSRTYTLSSFIWTLINTQLTQDIFFVSQKIENEHLKRRKYWHLCKLLTVSIFIKTFLFSLLYDVCDFFCLFLLWRWFFVRLMKKEILDQSEQYCYPERSNKWIYLHNLHHYFYKPISLSISFYQFLVSACRTLVRVGLVGSVEPLWTVGTFTINLGTLGLNS